MVAGSLLASAPAQAGATLDAVRERGTVRCGVTELGQTLSTMSASGDWVGFYAEVCRAFAAAVTGRPQDAEFIMVSTSNRFDGLRDGVFDVLNEPSTITMTRDAAGLEFATTLFHDGQGFLTYGPDAVKTPADLAGKAVCVQGNSTSVNNLRDYAAARNLNLNIMEFGTIEGAYSAFFGHQCAALSTDSLILASMRASLAPNPKDYVLLDDRISHEPLGPVVRDDDAAWEDVIRWTINVLLAAEDLGITAANAEALRTGGTAAQQRLLDGAGQADAMGLMPGWPVRVITQVGNYGEIFDRTIGHKAGLDMPRGRNALIRDGGLMWAPPVR